MWTSQMGQIMSQTLVSDGFMVNLGSVLLKLCEPFIGDSRNSKLLKIDFRYTKQSNDLTDDQRKEKHVHCFEIKEETCIQV